MNLKQLQQELVFTASRSSGAGGQHINKVSTKAQLALSIPESIGLSVTEKERILEKLASRIDKNGWLRVQCDESRSQHRNRELAQIRLFELMEQALKVPKKRHKTKPTRASKEKRKRDKQQASQKKVNRKRPELD